MTTQLHVDAADILLVNPRTRLLTYAAGRGFRNPPAQQSLRIGEGYAGQAAFVERVVAIPDLRRAPGYFPLANFIEEEAMVGYYAVPLVAKGRTCGVLEIFHRDAIAPDPAWMDFLTMLAGQAAIAIDSAALFSELRRAHAELALAYETTLEGWSRALDLRDRETEGHTKRVTEVTVRLARAIGVPEDRIVHVRRGVLLHDIGKMAMPDSILLKPGPLTGDEWTVMRQHPVYAFELLFPIEYLRPAIPIPYCHHEKWDGTGYPRELSGEQIPLEARIFAVVDMWDALRSNRPYRSAWPEDKVWAYLKAQSGTHFDPEVVKGFVASTN